MRSFCGSTRNKPREIHPTPLKSENGSTGEKNREKSILVENGSTGGKPERERNGAPEVRKRI
jgi:hypothetical protein